jgi:hypothetical protein
MNITELPFNRFMGITVSEKDGMALALPGELRYTNHLGTVHASALLALAEASSGDYLLKEFAHLGFEVVPVVRRLEAKFRKPALGAIFSKVNVAPAQREAFLSTLAQKGRALLEITVDVFDEKDTYVLAVTVEWFIGKK